MALRRCLELRAGVDGFMPYADEIIEIKEIERWAVAWLGLDPRL